ncbi:PDZ domain-containing protein [Candidatus Poribacteria bacterium]|nr:PDZ domain-containing protein [Candidatus Poribacteria bacterium]
MNRNIIVYSILGTLTIILTLSLMNCSSTIQNQNTDIQTLLTIQNAFVRIAEQAKPSVVGVTAYNVRNPLDSSNPWEKIPMTNGSGFIYRKDGYILTNDHVVDSAEKIEVTLLNGQKVKAKIVGIDANTDIAVIKIDVKEELQTLKLTNSDEVKVGQFTIAIGNPFGLDYSVTTGIVSGKGRDLRYYSGDLIMYHDFIQTDAWINQGNSGGPLLNIQGEVIGMNSMIRADSPLSMRFAGAGFSISANMLKSIGEQLIAKGQVNRGWLGIRMREDDGGVKVSETIKGNPAEIAGLQAGDVIIEYDGQPIRTTKELQWAVANTEAGKVVDIKVQRAEKVELLKVQVSEMPARYTGQIEANLAMVKLGMIVNELTDADIKRFPHIEEGDQGTIVQDIKPDGLAAKSGIRTGDLITVINGKKIHNVEECTRALDTAIEKKVINITVKTGSDGDKPEEKSLTINISDQ